MFSSSSCAAFKKLNDTGIYDFDLTLSSSTYISRTNKLYESHCHAYVGEAA